MAVLSPMSWGQCIGLRFGHQCAVWNEIRVQDQYPLFGSPSLISRQVTAVFAGNWFGSPGSAPHELLLVLIFLFIPLLVKIIEITVTGHHHPAVKSNLRIVTIISRRYKWLNSSSNYGVVKVVCAISLSYHTWPPMHSPVSQRFKK